MRTSTARLDEKVLLPDLLQMAPHVRPVLDRYGLHGCGGEHGPVETIGFFAKAHDVPLEQLLDELRSAMGRRPLDAGPTFTVGPADTLYRRFFTAGIAVVLTLGATWGAYLLWQIGSSHTFRAAGLHEINAHGHAQIFGWVGLFVMGFAYQAFPRFKHTSLAWPQLAKASFWMMLAGLVGRSVLEPFAAGDLFLVGLLAACSVLEIAAIALMCIVLAMTFRQAGQGLRHYDYYIIAALGWFLLQAIYDAVYVVGTLLVNDSSELLGLVSAWQAPLRDLQIHGFALLMILGVSQRLFHHFYGFRAPNPRLSLWVLACLMAAITAEVAGLILMRSAGHWLALLWYGGGILLAASVAVLIADWKIFGKPEETDRNLKFLRAAYVWLFVSLAMQVLLPVHQRLLLPQFAPESAAAQAGFSHAYYGAIRHAITVGFVSLMIMGVAAKVVPTLQGVNVHALSRLWLPFVLVNLGCAIRVAGQTLTDFTTLAFPFTGISGLLEVAGLALWGSHLLIILAGRGRLLERATAPGSFFVPLLPGARIDKGNRVADVLDQHPELLNVFLSFGFRLLASPVLRRTLAKHVTIIGACRKVDVPLEPFLQALNAALPAPASGKRPLPVIAETYPRPSACAASKN